MKRKREESHIQWLPVELFYHCLSWVPIRDVIISRRISRGWRTMIDSWKERFKTLSIMYDGPACFDPMNCPFEIDAYLLQDSLACMSSPPYSLHASRVLIGDALFQKDKFRKFFKSELIRSFKVTSVALRATVEDRDQTSDLYRAINILNVRLLDNLGSRLTDVAVDAHDMDLDEVGYMIKNLVKNARCENVRLYLPESEYNISAAYEILLNIDKLCKNVNLEGFGWENDPASSLLVYGSRTLRSFGVPITEGIMKKDSSIWTRHVTTIESLRFKICDLKPDMEANLCALVDICPRLRHAVLDIVSDDDEDDVPSFPWTLMEHLSRRVTSIRISIDGYWYNNIDEDPRDIQDILSFRRVELVTGNVNMHGIFDIILKKIKNIETLSIRRPRTYFLKGEVDYLCKMAPANTILVHGVKGPLSSRHGYLARRYHSESFILTRMIKK